jgi:hypothetical protein
MGLGVSLIVMAVGAILAWAVEDRSSGVNLDAVGVILMITGAIGFLLSLMLWSTWWGGGFFRRHTVVGAAPAGPRYRRRRAPATEEEVEVIEEGPTGPPAGPPY